MNTDQVIYETLSREIPLRSELDPAWEDVLARAATLPSRITRLRRRVPTSRWALAAALVAVAGLSLGGFALADEFGPLHRGTIYVDASTLGGPSGISTCNLIGKPAGQVAATLTSNGIGIEWRYTHWGTAVASTSAAPEATTPQQQAEVARRGSQERSRGRGSDRWIERCCLVSTGGQRRLEPGSRRPDQSVRLRPGP